MAKDYSQGREDIVRLCRSFEAHRDEYSTSGVKEAHVRQSLIDPMFVALGWDVGNTAMVAPRLREVIPEDSLEIEGHLKAPDYTFRVGTIAKYFVEAKKCGININANPAAAFQLRRYGWNAKVPLSILTDFEEFAVYDCNIRPRTSDKSTHGRLHYFSADEYPHRWREIWDLLSREAVHSGAMDRYAAAKRKRGTTEVDTEFLKEIEGWRDVLARNIALRNLSLSNDEVNTVVQRTIDRIIFLRMAEDRGLEPYGQLLKVSGQPGVYPRFVGEVCRRADDKYNSGIFHFNNEADNPEPPDTLSASLSVDDKVFKPILQGLYFEYGCPYHFGVLPVEILGTVYERFLGKVIRLTAGHQAKVEEKPEVRKAGGVYYTPSYVVDYIVRITIGEKVEGKSPAEIAGDSGRPALRILDLACGSGSFLLGAYQCLLDHCLKWYAGNKPERHTKAVYQDQKTGEWRLTINERKRLLTTHIFGVDIDGQAVEVTKLSLLLKALEGENDASLSRQMQIFQERALPDLSDNIKCGNSLIGTDYFSGNLIEDTDELRRINPFDWNTEFPGAITAGGFDCVIGNPPYVRQEALTSTKEYFQSQYRTFHGSADLYTYFIERGVSLLRAGGLFSYIVANKWMRSNYGRPLREWLKEQEMLDLVDFGDLPVFKGVTTYPCILRISKQSQDTHPVASSRELRVTQMETLDFQDMDAYVRSKAYPLGIGELDDKGWSLADRSTQRMLDKIRAAGIPLSQYVGGKIYYGIKTGLNEAFVIDRETRDRLVREDPKSAEIIKPFLAGRDIKRYAEPVISRFLIFTRHGVDITRYPAIERHLLKFKTQLMPRPKSWGDKAWQGRKPGSYEWYEIQDTVDYHKEFLHPKIVVPAIIQSASYIFDQGGNYSNDKTSIIATVDLYILGVLNSRLSDFVLHSISSSKQGGYFEYKPMYVSQIPIKSIRAGDTIEESTSAKIREHVEAILNLHKQLPTATSDQHRTVIRRQIESTDAEIDHLVYGLYGLSSEEVRVIEG
jgi:hypothetical protein